MEFPRLRKILATDVEAADEGDPAAMSHGEIISCYPGIKAITNYRIAHVLHELGVPLIPRMMTELAQSETGIDINPEATIGKHFKARSAEEVYDQIQKIKWDDILDVKKTFSVCLLYTSRCV